MTVNIYNPLPKLFGSPRSFPFVARHTARNAIFLHITNAIIKSIYAIVNVATVILSSLVVLRGLRSTIQAIRLGNLPNKILISRSFCHFDTSNGDSRQLALLVSNSIRKLTGIMKLKNALDYAVRPI